MRWTQEEIATVEEMAELFTLKQIAHRLKIRGYRRTTGAIATKLYSLGYSARPILDNYSCTEIAKVLNLNAATVSQWVRRGWIKTVRRSTRRYQIKSQDLKRFIKNPPQRVKKRIAALNKDAVEYLVGKIA
jgi:excisionase family DNA binding protein